MLLVLLQGFAKGLYAPREESQQDLLHSSMQPETSINQSINQSISQSVNQSISQSISQSNQSMRLIFLGGGGGANWDPTDMFSSVNSYRQALLPTCKAFPKETTTLPSCDNALKHVTSIVTDIALLVCEDAHDPVVVRSYSQMCIMPV